MLDEKKRSRIWDIFSKTVFVSVNNKSNIIIDEKMTYFSCHNNNNNNTCIYRKE